MPDITKLLKGRVFNLNMIPLSGSTNRYAPPAGKAWLVLGGNVEHVTGTATHVIICDLCFSGITFINQTFVWAQASGGDSGNINLWDTYPTNPAAASLYLHPQNQFLFVLGNQMLFLTGDAAAKAHLQILEFDC